MDQPITYSTAGFKAEFGPVLAIAEWSDLWIAEDTNDTLRGASVEFHTTSVYGTLGFKIADKYMPHITLSSVSDPHGNITMSDGTNTSSVIAGLRVELGGSSLKIEHHTVRTAKNQNGLFAESADPEDEVSMFAVALDAVF